MIMCIFCVWYNFIFDKFMLDSYKIAAEFVYVKEQSCVFMCVLFVG